MGRPRKTEEPVKERKTRTRKVEEPEVKTEQIKDPVLDEKKEDIPELVPEPTPELETVYTPDPEPEKPDDDYAVVNVSSFLNVREGPGKEYKSIWKFYNGDTVHIYEIKDGWGRIADYGWVSMDYLKKI